MVGEVVNLVELRGQLEADDLEGSENGELLTLVAIAETAERFLKSYEGNKAQMLGNGAARRALDEFRRLWSVKS